jgi:hypothetical protein
MHSLDPPHSLILFNELRAYSGLPVLHSLSFMTCALQEFSLLESFDSLVINGDKPDHGISTAPIITRDALDHFSSSKAFQIGLLGTTLGIRSVQVMPIRP